MKKVIEITIYKPIYLVQVHYMKVQWDNNLEGPPTSIILTQKMSVPFPQWEVASKYQNRPNRYPIIQVIVKTEYCIYYL